MVCQQLVCGYLVDLVIAGRQWVELDQLLLLGESDGASTCVAYMI